jgi:hypothetical protein
LPVATEAMSLGSGGTKAPHTFHLVVRSRRLVRDDGSNTSGTIRLAALYDSVGSRDQLVRSQNEVLGVKQVSSPASRALDNRRQHLKRLAQRRLLGAQLGCHLPQATWRVGLPTDAPYPTFRFRVRIADESQDAPRGFSNQLAACTALDGMTRSCGQDCKNSYLVQQLMGL